MRHFQWRLQTKLIQANRFHRKSWALSALGNVFIDQGRLDEAFIYCTKSMASVEEILGKTHLKTAACYYKVAWLFHKQGDLRRAM